MVEDDYCEPVWGGLGVRHFDSVDPLDFVECRAEFHLGEDDYLRVEFVGDQGIYDALGCHKVSTY